MAIRKHSLKAHGANKLTAHFRVREFACNDGSDEILICDKLAQLLEQIRIWAGAAILITSGYRTEKHNRRVNGDKNSKHLLGIAADIVVTGKKPADVARFAQAIGAGGVGLYTVKKFVHVDSRSTRSYWRNVGDGDKSCSGHGGKCPYLVPTSITKKGSKGNGVCYLQWWLRLWGYAIAVDGDFGAKTEKAVLDFQTRLGLAVDGIVGRKTRDALKGVL